MTKRPDRPPRAALIVSITIGSLLILLGMIAGGLAAASWIAVPGGAVRSAALIVESDDCPVLVLEQPQVGVEISGYERLQDVSGLRPEVEISTAGSIFTVPTETLPELVLGVEHCRLVANGTWKVVAVSGVGRRLDPSAVDMTTVEKSSAEAAIFAPGDLRAKSLIINEPGGVKVQGILRAPWAARDVQLLAVLGVVMVFIGVLVIVLGSRSRSQGKHELHE